ncbi:MAG: hypothetical protein MZV63_54270 [Marinilabiliales bacterium]|nr:hypothetical protein [Marinilabiliales bacterium]
MAVYELRRLITDSRAIMRELSSIAEKNEDVINSFSHKIREPLNNLVLLGNMLRETSHITQAAGAGRDLRSLNRLDG